MNNKDTNECSGESSPSLNVAFNESNFGIKLNSVVPTQDSIQSLGLWILHHKGNHEAICRIWIDKLNDSDVSSKQRLALFYLANEVIQNCRRKNAKIFHQTFRGVLLRAIEIVSQEDSIIKNVERVLEVWLERNVYESEFVNKLISKLQEAKSTKLKSPREDSAKTKETVAVNFTEENTSDSQSLDINMIEEIIAEFRVKILCESLGNFQSILKETNMEKSRIEAMRILDFSVDNLKQYRDKLQCTKFKTEFENSCVQLEQLLKMVDTLSTQRAELIKLMEKSEIFYEAQFNDAKKVNNVYRIYASKVNLMKKKLEDYINEKFDNKLISDMEMSDEETKEAISSQRNSGFRHQIRTNLDPRQNRSGEFDSNKKNSSIGTSKASSSSFLSSNHKRKIDTTENENESKVKKQSHQHHDSLNFLSKLINKSPVESEHSSRKLSGSVEADDSKNNLSFLVSSLQKFVNSGSGGYNVHHNLHQQQQHLNTTTSRPCFEEKYHIDSSDFMRLNSLSQPSPPPTQISSFYPNNHTSNGAESFAPLAMTNHFQQFYPVSSSVGPIATSINQLMEIDTQFPPHQLNYCSPTDQMNVSSLNYHNFRPQTQISPLMARKSDEYSASIDNNHDDFNSYTKKNNKRRYFKN